MNIREAIRNVKIGLTVVTGVAAVFGCAFVATTLVATAAEEEQAGVEAPVNEPSVESIDRPAPDGRRPGPEARGPSFTDIDRDGDGTISEEEFGSYLSYAPPRRFREAPRGRDGWGDRRSIRRAVDGAQRWALRWMQERLREATGAVPERAKVVRAYSSLCRGRNLTK